MTPQAQRAAEAYLREIDGNNYGTDNGYDIAYCAAIIDRETNLPALLEQNKRLREALEYALPCLKERAPEGYGKARRALELLGGGK